MGGRSRIRTGISGYDNLATGGFLDSSFNMLSGGTGSGKTIFALQYLWNGVTKFNEPSLYISTEELPEDLLKDALGFGWDFSKHIKSGKFAIKYYPPYDAKALSDSLREVIEEMGAKRVVVDSLSVFGVALSDVFEVRKLAYELSKLFKELGVTALVVSETTIESGSIESGAVKLSRFGVEEFVADSVSILHYSGLGGPSDRMLQILKMRRTAHKPGLHTVKIGNNGISVLAKG